MFIVPKSFPQKQFSTKNFYQKFFLWENVSLLKYYSKIIYLMKHFHTFSQKMLVKIHLWLQIHFLKNIFPPFGRNVLTGKDFSLEILFKSDISNKNNHDFLKKSHRKVLIFAKSLP